MLSLGKSARRHVPTGDQGSPTRLQRAIKRRSRATMKRSVAVALLAGFCVAATLWTSSNHRGLLLFGGLVVLSVILHWTLHLRLSIEADWRKRVMFCYSVGALPWGLLPVLARPEDSVWQAVVVGCLVGTLVSVAFIASGSTWSFYPFQITVATIATVCLVGLGDLLGAAMIVIASCCSAVLAHKMRVSGERSLANAIRTEDLAERLAKEQQLLQSANAQLAHQAGTDGLTGLANRMRFTKAVDATLAEFTAEVAVGSNDTPTVTVAFLDLDRFKWINDTYGHRVGDLLLAAVASRLHAMLVPGELLARHGGDELTVMSKAPPSDRATSLGPRLLSAFAGPYTIEGLVLDIGCSVGIAVAEPGSTTDELLRSADMALYRAKTSQGERLAYFDAAMRAEFETRKALEQELLQAFEQSQIVVYFQPIVDLGDGSIVGAEALARWEHSTGVRSASAFIDALVDVGLLERLNALVIGQVHDFGVMTAGKSNRQIPISVNVATPDLARLLTKFGNASALRGAVLEVSESHSFSDLDEASALIAQARKHGVQVVLDDFGVANTSLAVAARLEVDGLKLDRRLVSEINNGARSKAVIAAAVTMADRLGLDVIAEGVETHAQLATLRDLGVGKAQGFLFEAAIPMTDIIDLVATGHRYTVHGRIAT